MLLWAPGVIYFLFTITGDPVGDFLARRAAMLFVALAVMCWASRDAAPSAARNAIALGLAVGMIGLALTGAYEFVRGYVGIGIWLAIFTELAIAAAFLSACRRPQTP